MKVLIVLPSYDNGGAENYAFRLISFIGHEEIEWHVTSKKSSKDFMKSTFAQEGVITHYVSAGTSSPSKVLSFYRFLAVERFDAIMTFTGIFGGLPLTLAFLAGVKKRVGWHRRSSSAHSSTFINDLYSKISLFLLEKFSTKILSNSQAAFSFFHKSKWLDNAKFQLIPNGADSEKFKFSDKARSNIRRELEFSSDDYVIGHVGRFDPAKDHRTLFSIVSRLKAKKHRIKLLLVGSGTDENDLKNLAEELNIFNECRFLGIRKDVNNIYSAMDVFLFTSVTEGQPNALIEAMLSEIPIVATNIEPIKDTVPAFLYSNLFNPGDIEVPVNLLESYKIKAPYSLQELRGWSVEKYNLKENFVKVIDCLT